MELRRRAGRPTPRSRFVITRGDSAATAKDSHNNNCLTSLVHLAPKNKQPKVDKNQDGHIIIV
jgi:hypothetical protein